MAASVMESMSPSQLFAEYDRERRQRALAEEQLEDSRARCSALATENSRLSTVCNELTFRCVLSNVEVPHQAISQDQPQNFPKSFDFSSRESEYSDHTYSSRFWGDETRFEQAMPGPGRRVFTDASIASLCDFGPSIGIEFLDLSGCHITDAGVARICKGLPKLRQLDLSGCSAVSDASAPLIREFLQSLEVLDLSGTQMGNDGVAEVARLPRLRDLRCRGCRGVSDKGLVLLAEGLPRDNFIALDISGACVTDDGVIRLVQKMPNLVSLGLATCSITDAAVAAISHLKGIRNLNLSRCEALSEEGVSALRRCGSLIALDLSKTSCTASGLVSLQSLTKLKRLSLGSSGGLLQPELPSALPSPLGKLSSSMPSLPPPEPSPRVSQVDSTGMVNSSSYVTEPPRNPIAPRNVVQPQAISARQYETHRPFNEQPSRASRAKPMQLRRTVIAGFARRNLVPANEPESHIRELQDRRASRNPHSRRATHSNDSSFHSSVSSSKQGFTEADCKTQISKSTLVAKLRNSLEQDMTFRTMESQL